MKNFPQFQQICGIRIVIPLVILSIPMILYIIEYKSTIQLTAKELYNGKFVTDVAGIAKSFNKSMAVQDPHMCNYKHFQEIYRKTGYFPQEGSFLRYFFQPKACKLLARNIRPEEICFPQKKIKHIVTMGDSNGQRYFEALLQQTEQAYSGCDLVNMEKRYNLGFLPDKEYFGRGDKELIAAMNTKQRRCRECAGRRYLCTPKGGDIDNQLILESIGMPLWHDDTLTVNDKHPKHSKTFQEFIFRHYLTQKAPDVVIMFMPVNHMKHIGDLKSKLRSIDSVGSLIQTYLKNTTVYWVPGTDEVEHMKPRKWQRKIYEGLNVTQRITALNRHLFANIKEFLLEENPHHFGFFDLQSWSRKLVPFSFDGIHWEKVWYVKVMNAFLQLYCNS